MKLYCVVYMVGGYAREDATNAQIAGIFTDKAVADKVRLCVSGEIKEVELNAVSSGYQKTAMELFGVNLQDMLMINLNPVV
jgi:hypothetical protein